MSAGLILIQPGHDCPLQIGFFAGFSIRIQGREIDLRRVRPKARMLLRFLAAHTGRPVHREVLQEALWPEADPEAGAHNLHVAISALRRVLEPGVSRGESAFLVRDGDAYRLALPDEARVDLLRFDDAIRAARLAVASGDWIDVVTACREALAAYAGEVLPEDGPTDWAVRLRDLYRGRAVDTARLLAETLLEHGDSAGCADACAAGLMIDQYSDRLWRLAVVAQERSGAPVEAARTRRAYADILRELGVAPAWAEAS